MSRPRSSTDRPFTILGSDSEIIMNVQSAYIIQSQVICLGERPFEAGGKIRPIFRPIFMSKTCFTDMRASILNTSHIMTLEDLATNIPITILQKLIELSHHFHMRGVAKKLIRLGEDSFRSWHSRLPMYPFLRNLGQICFNTNSIRLTNLGSRGHRAIDTFELAESRRFLAEVLRGNEKYSDPKVGSRGFPDYHYFGYDRTLDDQRMNHLYFELRQPLLIKAIFMNKVQADGKIFVHLYPSGFLVLHLAISLKQHNLQELACLLPAIQETRPWRSDGHWTWVTKLGSGKLSDIVDRVIKNVTESLYTNTMSVLQGQRYSALKLVTFSKAHDIATSFIKGQYDLFEIASPSNEETVKDDKGAVSDANEYLLSSKQGVIYVLSPSRNRKSAHRLFWKIFTLYEFVALKNCIYKDYAEFLRSEITNLKEFRLSLLRKLTKEDTRQFSVFDPQIPRYLVALDKHIRSAMPFHRRIYSSISRGTGFDTRREKVLELLGEWEDEVSQWEHGLVALWQKLISPLRSILSG